MALVVAGTEVPSALLALGYELLLAVLGWFTYGAVAPGDRSLLRRAAIAWPLGVAIELVLFAPFAAIGVRWLLLPTLILAAGIAYWSCSNRPEDHECDRLAGALRAVSATGLLVFAGLFLAYLAVVGGQFFATQPLPGAVTSVIYYVDVPWHMSLVGELANRWPPSDPNIAGEPMRYHLLSHMHMAAVAQATGVDVPTVVLRTFFVAPILAMMLGFLAAGESGGRGGIVGLVAIALFLVSGELDFDARREAPFQGPELVGQWLSPSLVMGAPVFLAVLALTMRAWTVGRLEAGALAVLVLLAMLGEGTKGSLLPVLLAGVGLVFAWNLAVHRRWPTRPQLASSAGLLIAFVAVYLLLLSGAGGAIEIDPGAFVQHTVFDDLTSNEGTRLLLAAAALGLMMVSLIGILWMLLFHRGWSDSERLLLGCLVAGVTVGVVLSGRGAPEAYFRSFGHLAGLLLGGSGLLMVYQRVRDRRDERVISGLGLGLGLGLAALGVLGTAIRPEPIASSELTKATAGLVAVVGLGGIAAFAFRAGARRPALVLFVTAGLLGASSLNTVVDVAAPRLASLPGPHYPAPQPPATRGLTSGIYEGLEWVRAETPKGAVLAVSNQHNHDVSGDRVPRYFLYSAISERRTFIGGWDYSQLATDPGEPAATILPRLEASRAVLRSENCADLRSATADAPVSHALYDRVNSAVPEELRRLVAPAFENGDIAIYDVDDALDRC